jgi:hypothetical protein
LVDTDDPLPKDAEDVVKIPEKINGATSSA